MEITSELANLPTRLPERSHATRPLLAGADPGVKFDRFPTRLHGVKRCEWETFKRRGESPSLRNILPKYARISWPFRKETVLKIRKIPPQVVLFVVYVCGKSQNMSQHNCHVGSKFLYMSIALLIHTVEHVAYMYLYIPQSLVTTVNTTLQYYIYRETYIYIYA